MDAQVENLIFNLSWSQPELLLAGFALAATLVGAAFRDRAAGLLGLLGAAVIAAAGALAFLHRPDAPVEIFNGSLRIDQFAAFAKAIIGFAAAATLLLGVEAFSGRQEARFEFPILVTLSALGFFVMASSNDLIALYIGIELQSLASYVLAAFRRDDARSSEAGLKYFVLGALSSGLLLYGASLVYGFSGSVRFDAIAAAITSGVGGPGLIFGLVFLICGVAFKMSAAPFHMWTPDVYEGAPTPVTAMFAAAPKVAAAALLIRVLYGPFGGLEDQWRQVIVALSALSFLVGAFAALVQTNIKRLMAYSSINNMGFVLMAIAAGPAAGGGEAALLYLALYLPATIGIFAVILAMRRGGLETESIDDLAGLARRSPGLALVLTALFFSLAGIPPLAGFFGKVFAFEAALAAGLWPLAIVGALATVVAAGYYLRVLAIVWFRPAAPDFDRSGGAVILTAAAATALSFPGLVLALSALQAAARAAAQSSFPPP